MKKFAVITFAALMSAAAFADQSVDLTHSRPAPQIAHGVIPSLQEVNTDYVSHRDDDRQKLQYTGERVHADNPAPVRMGSDR